MDASALPQVSVVVVCRNEERNLPACLDSLLAQNYPATHYELLVVDNASTDATPAILAAYQARDSRVRSITNDRPGIAASRNCGLATARYQFVAFTDADCVAPATWLLTLVQGLLSRRAQDPNTVGVGGSNVAPPDAGRFTRVLGLAITTYWANHGSVQGKVMDSVTAVPHLPTVNVLYDRRVVLEVGGFDEAMGSIGEDEDLSHRLTRAGHSLYYLPNAHVYHRLRATPGAWARNMFIYGQGRVQLARRHALARKPVLAGPALLMLALLATPLGASVPVFLAPLAYFPAMLLVGLVEAGRRGRLAWGPEVAGIYVLTHLAYGLGELAALLQVRRHRPA